MDRIHVLPLKTVPRWVLIGLITIGLILGGFLIKFVASRISPNDQFATLTFVNGEVEVSDGFTGTAASTGPLATRNVRTLLKTGDGTAGLQLPDGSSVIIDSDSTIEFKQKNDNDPFQTFAFNLVKGRILVVSEKNSQTPTQILLGGTEIVEVLQATVGMVAINGGMGRGRVDCLDGQCLVNGVYLLNSGQNAQIGTKNIIHVSDGILTYTWILLSKASGTSLALSMHFERILLALTNTVIPTGTTFVANQFIPITGMKITPSTPSLTSTLRLTGTATRTQTNFIFRRVLPSPTSSENFEFQPFATFTPGLISTPTTIFVPSKSPTTSQPIAPTNTSIPTQTYTATIAPTATPNPTSAPTATLKPTITPKPTNTPRPTHTPKNPPPPTPTNTVEPLPTATFTATPIP